jgi:hypothetical protein
MCAIRILYFLNKTFIIWLNYSDWHRLQTTHVCRLHCTWLVKKQTCTLTCMLYVSPILLYYFKIVTKIPANSNLSGTHEGKFMFYMFFINLCHFITQRFCCIFEYFLLKNVTSGPRSFLGQSTCFRLPVLITMHINYKNPKVKVTKNKFSNLFKK